MARVVIVGCGCRGRALAGQLLSRGHAVRGTTRDAGKAAAIADAGAEPFVGDPDRVATIVPALDGAGVLCLLLGSASGPPESLAALHGTRLEMLLTRLIDTPARAVVYEGRGSVDESLLRAGADAVRAACGRFRIPHAVLEEDPVDRQAWIAAALAAIEGSLVPAINS